MDWLNMVGNMRFSLIASVQSSLKYVILFSHIMIRLHSDSMKHSAVPSHLVLTLLLLNRKACFWATMYFFSLGPKMNSQKPPPSPFFGYAWYEPKSSNHSRKKRIHEKSPNFLLSDICCDVVLLQRVDSPQYQSPSFPTLSLKPLVTSSWRFLDDGWKFQTLFPGH